MTNTLRKGAKKPSIYVDTCIARDVTERRRDASSELISRIKRKGWSCKMSIFGLMELVDIEQESLFVNQKYFVQKLTLDEVYSRRRNRDLGESDLERGTEYITQFLENYSFIEFVALDDDNWSTAALVASYCNLGASDVIHLVSARQADCDVLVTNDTFFIAEATKYIKSEKTDKPKVCKPEDCFSVLSEMGFTDL